MNTDQTPAGPTVPSGPSVPVLVTVALIIAALTLVVVLFTDRSVGDPEAKGDPGFVQVHPGSGRSDIEDTRLRETRRALLHRDRKN